MPRNRRFVPGQANSFTLETRIALSDWGADMADGGDDWGLPVPDYTIPIIGHGATMEGEIIFLPPTLPEPQLPTIVNPDSEVPNSNQTFPSGDYVISDVGSW